MHHTEERGTIVWRWLINHPIIFFILAFSISSAMLTWLLWYMATTATEFQANAGDASSSIGAVLGTAVTGAGAFVALVIAVAALHSARVSNRLSDPDYVLAKEAVRRYQKFILLIGALIALYRTYKHEAAHASQDSTQSVGRFSGNGLPRWNHALLETRDLLFNTAFITASYEAARYVDQISGVERSNELHGLRHSIAGLAAVLERVISQEGSEHDIDSTLLELMARTKLLETRLSRCWGMLRAEKNAEMKKRLEESPVLVYLRDWVPERVAPEFDAEIINNIKKTSFADFFGSPLLSNSKDYTTQVHQVLGSALEAEIKACRSDLPQGGYHEACVVVTSSGDFDSILTVTREACAFAEAHDLKPVVIDLSEPHVAGAAIENLKDKYLIYYVRPRSFPLLFKEDVIPVNAQGCVLIDGLRSEAYQEIQRDFIGSYQFKLYESDREKQRTCLMKVLVEYLLDQASEPGLRFYKSDVQIKRECETFGSSGNEVEDGQEVCEEFGLREFSGPRLAWIGFDYRAIGETPRPCASDADGIGFYEVFASSHNLMLGNDAGELIGR